MTDNELLLALSNILDAKLKPLNERMKRVEIMIENDIKPRIQNMESCYTSTYDRYQNGITEIDALRSDMDVVKKVVTEHSEKLRLSCHFTGQE